MTKGTKWQRGTAEGKEFPEPGAQGVGKGQKKRWEKQGRSCHEELWS